MVNRPSSDATPLAGSALWLVSVSTAFTIHALSTVRTRAAFAWLAVGAVIGFGLAATSIVILRMKRQGPRHDEPDTPEERRMMRWYWWTLGAEVVAIMAVNAVAGALGQTTLMVPLDLLIVGVHFLPLARIFHVPRYYPLGAAFCAVSIVTLAVFSADARIGQGLSRYVVPTLGCTAAAWLTAVGNLNEAFHLLSRDRPS